MMEIIGYHGSTGAPLFPSKDGGEKSEPLPCHTRNLVVDTFRRGDKDDIFEHYTHQRGDILS